METKEIIKEKAERPKSKPCQTEANIFTIHDRQGTNILNLHRPSRISEKIKYYLNKPDTLQKTFSFIRTANKSIIVYSFSLIRFTKIIEILKHSFSKGMGNTSVLLVGIQIGIPFLEDISAACVISKSKVVILCL